MSHYDNATMALRASLATGVRIGKITTNTDTNTSTTRISHNELTTIKTLLIMVEETVIVVIIMMIGDVPLMKTMIGAATVAITTSIMTETAIMIGATVTTIMIMVVIVTVIAVLAATAIVSALTAAVV